MCKINALNKISEVEYLSVTIVRAVKFWLWLGSAFFGKITNDKNYFPEALCKSEGKKRYCNSKKQKVNVKYQLMPSFFTSKIISSILSDFLSSTVI